MAARGVKFCLYAWRSDKFIDNPHPFSPPKCVRSLNAEFSDIEARMMNEWVWVVKEKGENVNLDGMGISVVRYLTTTQPI